MKIAVLGASGMLGSNVVVQSVARGHAVIAVSRSGKTPTLANVSAAVDHRAADVGDAGALTSVLKDVDAVIHCAGYYPSSRRSLSDELENTRRQAEAFYRACSIVSLEKIVFVGAAIAVPRNQNGDASDGQASYDEAPRDKNTYVQVKWLQDDLARRAASTGLPVVIGVPAMTFGEYDSGKSTGRFILGVAHGSMRGYVDGKRNVVYAGDAARGLVQAAEAGKPSRRYLFTGQNVTMEQLMSKVSTLLGKPVPRSNPLQVVKAIRNWQVFRHAFLSGPEPVITDTALAVMSSGQFLDGSIAEAELGYRAQISVDEALERAIRWFVSQKMIPGQ